MANKPRPWTVTQHQPIAQIDENLWTVDGAVPGIPGGNFPRKMMIVKLTDGTLLLHNMVPLDEPGMAALEKIGRPSILIAPSPFHCIDAHAMKERLVSAKLHCPAKSAAAIGQVAKVDGDYGALPDDPVVKAVPLDGTNNGEAVFLVRSGPRVSMLMCDVMLNIPHLPGFWGFVWKMMKFTGGPRCGPVWLKRAVVDRKALKAHLERLAATPDLARLVPSHGLTVDVDPAGTLRAVAAPL